MANLVTDFSTSIKAGVITFKDASTANYGGETITDRNITLTFSDGTTETIAFPLVNGVGDEVKHTTTKDLALEIELELTPDTPDGTSVYVKEEPVLAASFTDACLEKRRRENILETDPKNILSQNTKGIEQIEQISSYYESAKIFMGIGDFIGAQEAIDLSFALCPSTNCGC